MSRYNLAAKFSALGSSPTSHQLVALEDSRLVLRKRISAWRQHQLVLTPEAVQLLDASNLDEPEKCSLYVPSELKPLGPLSSVAKRMVFKEARLRLAQCTDALRGIRRSIALREELSRYKSTQVCGQHANTRARSTLDSAQAKLLAIVARYRRARAALLRLHGPGEWESTLRPLNDSDLRPLPAHQDGDLATGPREGYRQLSWIFLGQGATNTELELHEGT